MGAEAAELQPLAPSLYELEQDLMILLDTEDLVSDEQRLEFETALQTALKNTVAKRDRSGQFLAYCEMQEQSCDREIKRLQARKKTFQSAHERMEQYLQTVIFSLGMGPDGKYRKLQGDTVTFAVCKNPDAVEILDESAIPLKYKQVTLTVNAELWSTISKILAGWTVLKEAITDMSSSLDKNRIKSDLKQNLDIPGARLRKDAYRLERR